MYFSPVLVLAALPFLVAAAPVDESPHDGFSIPIAKRSVIRNADGTVDIGKLQAHVQRTVAKIQRGFDAFEINTGSAHPSASQLMRSNKRQGNGVPLVYAKVDDNFELWYGPITVGTPAATYTVKFDTGSSDLLLPGSDCDSTCAGHKLYDPNSSLTSSDFGQTFNITNRDGSTVSGEQYTDDVAIAGYMATGQRLGAAKTYPDAYQFDHFPSDGVLGMGYQSISSFGASPVFQTLVSQGLDAPSAFSFYLADLGSELYIGGTNPAHYQGAFTYMPVTAQGFWQGSFDAISVSGRTVIRNSNAIIDTGTAQVIGDLDSVQDIYNQIPGSKGDGFGTWTIPCDFNTPISMTFEGREFQINPSTFNLGPQSSDPSTCVGGFSAQDGLGIWVIGDVFLLNVYTMFDLKNNRVGFASLALALA